MPGDDRPGPGARRGALLLLRRAAPVLLLGAYLAVLINLGRAITNEDWDGIKSVNNALLISGAGEPRIGFDGIRPPMGCLLLSPWLSWAYRAGGPEEALRACRTLMPCVLALLLWACHYFYSRLLSGFSAFMAVVLMACNPLLLQFAPFAAFDIFSALAFLPFLWAAYRHHRRPGLRSFALLAASYVFAFLSKYHLGAGILVPLAFLALDPEIPGGPAARLKRLLRSPLWLLPALCWALAVAFLGAVISAATNDVHGAWLQARRELWINFSFNVLTRKASHWYLYAESLWRQLDWGLAALMLWGVWGWLRGGQERTTSRTFFLALALLVTFLALSFGIANKEARYAIPLLPLVYAAIGQGLDQFLRKLPNRRTALPLVAGGCLLLAPWGQSLASARYLLHEPSIHTRVPWRLAQLLERRVEPSGCVAWIGGDLEFPIEEPLYRYEYHLILGAPTFQFFVRRKIQEFGPSANGGAACKPSLALVPRQTAQGERWREGPLARVYEIPAGVSAESWAAGPMEESRLVWEVFPDRVRELPARLQARKRSARPPL